MIKQERLINAAEHNYKYIPFSGIAFGVLSLGNFLYDQSLKISSLFRKLTEKLKPKQSPNLSTGDQITEQEWNQAMQDAIGHEQPGDWRRTPGKVVRINKR